MSDIDFFTPGARLALEQWRQAVIEALRETLATLKAGNALLRGALGEIRTRSWTGVMRSNKSELDVALADICLFVDVVLWKENSNG